jgi:hypothetical protein
MYAAVPTDERLTGARRLPPPPALSGTLPAAPPAAAWWLAGRDGRPPEPRSMIPLKPRQIFIQGVTRQGRTFRPSDWAERLAGAMSCFRPGGGVGGISAAIGYSPYCFPRVIDGVKCVIVSEELRSLEPMAWDFVLNFARDNDLMVVDACLLPERPSGEGGGKPA